MKALDRLKKRTGGAHGTKDQKFSPETALREQLFADEGKDTPEENGLYTGAEEPSVEKILPTALQQMIIREILFSIVLLIFVLTLTFWEKNPRYLAGLIIAAFFAYQAYSVKLDYREGKIREESVRCVSIHPRRNRKDQRVVFRTEDDPPRYFEFLLPASSPSLLPDAVYVIYYRQAEPGKLLAYLEL